LIREQAETPAASDGKKAFSMVSKNSKTTYDPKKQASPSWMAFLIHHPSSLASSSLSLLSSNRLGSYPIRE
jgi:hypothetical protein